MDFMKRVLATRDELNRISPSFCLAKWQMVTLHLAQGETHSCYHPPAHKIPIAEIEADPSALHNTRHKKEQRKQMLEGKRPAECQYCWNVEDLAGEHVSDRMIRSSEDWLLPHMDRISKTPWDANVNPSYVEVNFANTCNLKCAYCNPSVSSKWLEEVREHGGYKTSTRFNDYIAPGTQGPTIPRSEKNPYIEAFWKWWPDLYKDLEVFRVTGGEPLLSPDTFRALDWIAEHPKPELEIFINSNLSVPKELIDKFIDRAATITRQKKVRQVTVYASVDTHGAQAEYIRTGLDYAYFMRNVERILTEVPESKVSFMVTFNALSIPRFDGLLKDILALRAKHNVEGSPNRLMFDTPYLRYPPHLSVQVLPPEFAFQLQKHIDFMKRESRPGTGFEELEVRKLERLCEWMIQGLPVDDRARYQRDFHIYFAEHDRRRGTNFEATFPELAEFYRMCGRMTQG